MDDDHSLALSRVIAGLVDRRRDFCLGNR